MNTETPEPKSEETRPGSLCEEIQAGLFDYLTREMGTARATLVNAHLRKCQTCQKVAAEMQSTLDLLHVASAADANLPAQLTEDRRRRLFWAFSHPVLDWLYRHHVLVSLAVTALALSLLFTFARHFKIWEDEPEQDLYPVTVVPNEDTSLDPTPSLEISPLPLPTWTPPLEVIVPDASLLPEATNTTGATTPDEPSAPSIQEPKP